MIHFADIRHYFTQTLWSVDTKTLPRPQAWSIWTVRMLFVVVRDISKGELNLRAMSLVYTTMLSIVPLLAVSFSVLKAFGVHNMIEPTLLNFLAPLGEKGVEITEQVIGFVENIKVGVLGSVGVGLLLYTVVSLVQKIESSFNFIWNIETPRGFTQRFSEYLSVILVGPVLVFSAMGMTATLMDSDVMQTMRSMAFIGVIFVIAGKMVPYVLAVCAFAFVYKFIPNIKVKMKAALMGGLVAGITWNTSGYLFASFVVSSTKYTAIYSGFAILILLIIWIYLSWLILLVGSQIAFYIQRPDLIRKQRGPLSLSNRIKETLALTVMLQVADNFYHGRRAWDANELASQNDVKLAYIQTILGILQNKGWLVKSTEQPATYVPAHSLEHIQISELLKSIREMEEDDMVEHRPLSGPAAELMEQLEQGVDQWLSGKTLKDLVIQQDIESAPSESGKILRKTV